MSLVYVAASWREVGRAKDAARWLRNAGFEVWAFREKHPEPLGPELEEWEALADGDSDAGRTAPYLRLYHAKLDCLLAIREADCLVLVEPAGNDAYYEAGFALAQDVPVVRFGRGRPGLMIFDAPVAADLDDLVDLVRIHVGKQALPRQLQEPGTRNPEPGKPPLVRTGQGDFVKDYPASPGQRLA